MLPINNNLHRYSACSIQRNCVFCVNVIENEHLLFACPLYNELREKLLNDMSQNAVTASLENVLSGKAIQICFDWPSFFSSAITRRKEFTGSFKLVLRYSIVHNRLFFCFCFRCLLLVHVFVF